MKENEHHHVLGVGPRDPPYTLILNDITPRLHTSITRGAGIGTIHVMYPIVDIQHQYTTSASPMLSVLKAHAVTVTVSKSMSS